MINRKDKALDQNAANHRLPLLFLFLFFIVSIYMNFSAFVGIYDEGISSYGSWKVLQGGVPYRDFWTCYGPGQFYALAGLFKVFGVSLITERLWTQLVTTFILIFSYLILNKSCSRKTSLVGTGVMAFLLLNYSPTSIAGINPMFPAILFAMASSYFLLNFFTDGSKRCVFLSGACAAMVALFRPELGMAISVLEAVIVAIQRKFNGLFLYLLSVFIVLFPVVIFLFSRCKPRDLLFDLVIFPLHMYSKMRAVSFTTYLAIPDHYRSLEAFLIGFSKEIICFFPVAVLLTATLLLIGHLCLRIKDARSTLWHSCVIFTIFGLICFKYSCTRVDFAHFFPVLCISIILLFLLLSFFLNIKYLRLWFSCLVIFFCLALSLNLFEELKTIEKNTVGVLDIKRAQGLPMNPVAFYLQETVKYVQKRVPTGEKIFVGSISHNRVVINDVLFYFLADRGDATKYYEFQPGITTTKEIQQHIIEDLEKAKVRFVILSDHDWWCEPNDSCHEGAYLLDQFIRKNFKVVRIIGGYTVLRRDIL